MCSNTVRKTPIITCKHCGAQYLPGEIYMPGAFIGKPEDIVKDSLGRILYEDYQANNEPDMVEHYTCDFCNKPFIIEATLTYKTSAEVPEKDFTTAYVSLL